MDGGVRIAGSEETDRRMYPYLRTAVINLGIMDVPSLDFGFVNATTKLAKGIQAFEANGVPMATVTRHICKFLLNAMRRRDQDLSNFPSDPGAEMLSYKDTPDLVESHTRLLRVTREARADAQTTFNEQLRAAIAAGALEMSLKRPSERPTKKTPERPTKKEEPYVPKSGPKPPTGATPPKVKPETKSASHPPWNAIDQGLWREHYGNEHSGQQRKLCYFHANRPGGCVKTTDCEWEHDVPGRYGGKQYEELSLAKAEFIVKQCTRP